MTHKPRNTRSMAAGQTNFFDLLAEPTNQINLSGPAAGKAIPNSDELQVYHAVSGANTNINLRIDTAATLCAAGEFTTVQTTVVQAVKWQNASHQSATTINQMAGICEPAKETLHGCQTQAVAIHASKPMLVAEEASTDQIRSAGLEAYGAIELLSASNSSLEKTDVNGLFQTKKLPASETSSRGSIWKGDGSPDGRKGLEGDETVPPASAQLNDMPRTSCVTNSTSAELSEVASISIGVSNASSGRPGEPRTSTTDIQCATCLEQSGEAGNPHETACGHGQGRVCVQMEQEARTFEEKNGGGNHFPREFSMSRVTATDIENTNDHSGDTAKNRDQFRKKRKLSEGPKTSRLPPSLGMAIDVIEAKEHKQALADLFGAATGAGIDLLPINLSKIDDARSYLECLGLKSAKKRSEAWRRACDAVPLEHRDRLGLQGQTFGVRRCARLEAKPSKYPKVQVELDAWMEIATRPINGICDMHDPLAAKTAGRYSIQVMKVVDYLDKNTFANGETLKGILSPRAIKFYLQTIDDEDGKNGTGTNVRNVLISCGRVARDLWGKTSAAATFIARQVKARGKGEAPLSDDDIRRLLKLAQPDEFNRLTSLRYSLMEEAQSEKLCTATRLMLANFAVMLAVQAELLLRPGDLSALRFDGKDVIVSTRVSKAAGDLSLTATALSFLEERSKIRRDLKLSAVTFLFPSKKHGHQEHGRVATAMGIIMRDRAFPGLTMQILRDLGAIMLLLDDNKDVRRVADLLDVKSIAAVRRRYAAFLWG